MNAVILVLYIKIKPFFVVFFCVRGEGVIHNKV